MRPKEVQCPECEQEFELEEGLQVGDITYCPDCEAELKITRLSPPSVEVAKAEEGEFDGKEGGDDENNYPDYF